MGGLKTFSLISIFLLQFPLTKTLTQSLTTDPQPDHALPHFDDPAWDIVDDFFNHEDEGDLVDAFANLENE